MLAVPVVLISKCKHTIRLNKDGEHKAKQQRVSIFAVSTLACSLCLSTVHANTAASVIVDSQNKK